MTISRGLTKQPVSKAGATNPIREGTVAPDLSAWCDATDYQSTHHDRKLALVHARQRETSRPSRLSHSTSR